MWLGDTRGSKCRLTVVSVQSTELVLVLLFNLIIALFSIWATVNLHWPHPVFHPMSNFSDLRKWLGKEGYKDSSLLYSHPILVDCFFWGRYLLGSMGDWVQVGTWVLERSPSQKTWLTAFSCECWLDICILLSGAPSWDQKCLDPRRAWSTYNRISGRRLTLDISMSFLASKCLEKNQITSQILNLLKLGQ